MGVKHKDIRREKTFPSPPAILMADLKGATSVYSMTEPVCI